MSVIKSLQNVQQDIMDGFRALTSLDVKSRHGRLKELRAQGISLDAGADLLYRFFKDWSDIQSCAAESCKKAEEVDKVIAQLLTRYDRQWQSACRLEKETANVLTFSSTLKDMLEVVDSLQQDFQAVEEELDRLVDVCEAQVLQQEKESQRSLLANYKKNKEAEVLIIKGKLWKNLRDDAKDLEGKSPAPKETVLEDRHGSSTDEDKSQKFESSGEGEDLMHSGAFIEDDYTADYSAKDEFHEHLTDLDSHFIDVETADSTTTGVDNIPASTDNLDSTIAETTGPPVRTENADSTATSDSKTAQGASEVVSETSHDYSDIEVSESHPEVNVEESTTEAMAKENDVSDSTEECSKEEDQADSKECAETGGDK